jgi:LmbE family N-acetylglucosaminyl deacetylase
MTTSSLDGAERVGIGATVFLFAHQDDEVGVFPYIEQALAAGLPVWCIYLTDGAYGGQSGLRRVDESRGVLERLGVDERATIFLGSEMQVPDGSLVDHLPHAHERLSAALDKIGAVGRLVFHAWEGGHQDHDAVHILGLAAARRLNLLDRSYQFPLYRASGTPFLPYALFAPLPQNGPVIVTRVVPRDRWRYLGLTTRYRSQAKTLIALYPMLFSHELTDGCRRLQPVSPGRSKSRPHGGPLLYERRGRFSFEAFRTAADEFVAQFVL